MQKMMQLVSCLMFLCIMGCGPKDGTETPRPGNANTNVNTNVAPQPPVKPKIEWSNGSTFVPTTELTTCQVGDKIYRIFLPDNRNNMPNRYYYSPVLQLKYLKNGRARPPVEFALVNIDLNLNQACKKRICTEQGKPNNCIVHLSPLPVSWVEVGPQKGHPASKLYKRSWRKRFSQAQHISGTYTVVMPRHNTKDTIQFCPLPMVIKYRYRAFKGSVAPQVVVDLRTIANSSEFSRLSQKVKMGSGNTPTLVSPHQVQKLITKQVAHFSKYTINMYDRDGNPSSFMRNVQGKLVQQFENILNTNLQVNLVRFHRMSKELVSGNSLVNRLPTIINNSVSKFNSAKTLAEQKKVMSHKESWDFFSVLAKGTLEALGLKDQPTKWTDDEWSKFVRATQQTFKWQRDSTSSKVWRIRAINLMQLSTQNQVQGVSVRSAKFTLSGLSYVENSHAIRFKCAGIPGDRRCDKSRGEKPGTAPGADCGYYKKVCRTVVDTHTRTFTHRTPPCHNCGGIRGSGVKCVPGTITNVQYSCSGCCCGWSYNPGGGYGINYKKYNHNRCFRWWRKWDGKSVIEHYKVTYTKPRQVCEMKFFK